MKPEQISQSEWNQHNENSKYKQKPLSYATPSHANNMNYMNYPNESQNIIIWN